MENGQLTISETATIRSNAGTSSYTVLAQGSNANVTIEGGTITSYSSANSASITVYALLGATAHITGGTFYALDNISNASNVSPIRTGADATMTIDGGTFYGGESGTQFQAVSIRGGETTINGGTFTAATGIRAMDWADATPITGKLTVKGGTFNTTAQAIYVSSKANDSRNAHSEVTIEGGKFKSTGSTIVQMDAAPAGADPSTLTITGGFFNEKSGTTFKTQIANFVSDPYEVFTLEDGDANKTAGYAYEVCEKRVAKVKTGSTTKYYTTVLAAMNYAKTVANPTITMLHDASLSARWVLDNAIDNWNGVLDLNGKTITSAAGGMTYGMIDVTKAGIKLTIKDSATGGKLLRQDAGTAIWGININNGATLELQSGTIEVKNTITGISNFTQGVCINTNGGTFNMTGGKVEVHAEKNIYGLNIYKGTANLSGGELAVATDLTETLGNYAYGVYQQTSASALNISGTATVSTKAATEARGIYSNGEGSTIDITGGKIKAIATGANAYGLHIYKTATVTISGADSIYAKSATRAYTMYVSVGTTTISGTPAFYAESPTGARVLQGTGSGSITVNGGIFDAKVTTDGKTDCYALIPEGTSTLTVNGGKFTSNRNNIAYKGASATLTINGGYYNESSGTYHKNQIESYCVAPKHAIEMTAAEISTVGSDYKYKVVDAYTLTWTTDGDALTGTYTQGITAVGAAITAPATPTKTGYTFAAWTPAVAATMPAANTTYTATWTANTNTAYTVKHYQQNIADDEYTLFETENLKGTTDASVTPAVKTYTGFTAPATQTVTILPDGSRVVEYRYTRKIYTVLFIGDGGVPLSNPAAADNKWRYGATPTYTGTTPTKESDVENDYTFTTWSPAITTVTGDASYTAQFSSTARFYGEQYRLDIIDYTANGAGQSIKLNMNQYLMPTAKIQWTIQVNDGTKYRNATSSQVWDTQDHALTIPALTLTAGEQIILSAYDGVGDDATCLSRLQYVVPEIITANKTITAAASQILYVRSGNLTINGDINVARVYVNPGATLTINSGKTLTVTDRLVLRTRSELNVYNDAPELVNNGTLTFSGSAKMYYSRIVSDKSQAYQIGFPFSTDLTQTVFSNGKTAIKGSHYGILYYDSRSRAENGIGENWKNLEETTMNANQGYQILTASDYYYEILFSVTYEKRNNGEAISVTAYSGENSSPYDCGWNYIVQPYTNSFECHYAQPEENIKVSMLDADNHSFYQDVATELQPATPFYYQAKESGQLVFDQNNFRTQMQSRIPRNSSSTQWVRLLIANDENISSQDVTNLFFNPDKFTPNYDRGYDVVKLSTSANRPLIWTSVDYGNMAFTALPDSMAQQLIPLTTYANKPTEYTFYIEQTEYLNRVDKIILLDMESGSRTDLLYDDYTTYLENETTKGRFFLQIVLKAPSVTTDIENNGEDASENNNLTAKPRKVFIDGRLYIIMPDGTRYSAIGQKL